MDKIFAVVEFLSIIALVVGAGIIVMEVSGRSVFTRPPFLRPTGLTWTAADVATTGITAAVLIGTLSVGADIVIVPGYVTLNPARGLEPVVGLLFGVPGAVGAMIANPIYDILTGKFTLGSIAGLITSFLSAYTYYRLLGRNPGLAGFRRPRVFLKYAAAVIIATLGIKALTITGWLAELNLVPAHVAWFVTFPGLFLGQAIPQLIVGPLVVKVLYPYARRLGLTADRRRSPVPAAARAPAESDERIPLRLEDVSFTYDDGARPAISGITVEVEPGEIVGVVGPNGAGKTTFCLALNGLVPQAAGGELAGAVLVYGVDTRTVPVRDLSTRVGTVLQSPEAQFFGESVEEEVAFGPENLRMPAAEIDQRVEHALATVGMAGTRDRFPFRLSGGQQQRVAIAMALAPDPMLLVLDEPTSELDPLGKEEVFQTIRRLRKDSGRTVVVATHETDELVQVADRIIVLGDDGTVRHCGGSRDALSGAITAQTGVREPELFELWRTLPRGDEPPLTVAEAAERLPRLAVRPPARERPEPGAPIITCAGLRHTYGDGQEALRGVDLSIGAGEMIAVMGRNGSGKTTLTKHLNGLLRPTAGTVTVDGTDTAAASVAQLAQTVGYMFQNPDHQLFARTVAEEFAFGLRNIGVPDGDIGPRTREALDLVELDVPLDHYPHFLGKGERQKLALATVLAMRPRILVVDEPTTGQDARSAAATMRTLQELNRRGHTILFVTHDSRVVAEYAQRVLVMADGELITDGPPETVLYDTDVMARAAIKPPPVVRLARLLADGDAGPDVLTIGDLVHCLGREGTPT
jgi:energy-coupling factor transporter ATP-binding protein EcfA2